MKNTYLCKLYVKDKLLFYAISIFIAGQLFFTFKGVETFPWLNYGMYSQVKLPGYVERYDVYNIKIGGSDIYYGKLLDPQREMVFSSLDYYRKIGYLNNDEARLEKVIDDRLAKKLNPTQLQFVKSRLLNSADVKEAYPPWLLRYLGDMRILESANLVVERNVCTYYRGKMEIEQTDTIAIYDDAAQ